MTTKGAILGPDAVAVIERLATVPFETISELSEATGLSPDRVLAATKKLEKIGLIDTYRMMVCDEHK